MHQSVDMDLSLLAVEERAGRNPIQPHIFAIVLLPTCLDSSPTSRCTWPLSKLRRVMQVPGLSLTAPPALGAGVSMQLHAWHTGF